MGTVTDKVPSAGELLSLAEYGRHEFLDGLRLEAATVQVLERLGETVNWWNRTGESNSFPDMEVRSEMVDCKGSTKYYASMFIGCESYETMTWRRGSYGQIWYVLNDLSVVSWDEFETYKERKNGGWRMASLGRSIREWLGELDASGNRRCGDEL